MTSEASGSASSPGTAAPGRRKRRFRRLSAFWQQVTEGARLGTLWEQFKTEARSSYGLYSREVDWEAVGRAPRWKRPFRAVWALFVAMLMKLSPARRVLLLAAVVLLLLGPYVTVARGRKIVVVHAGWLGVALLFVLLALELADRVTMKRDLEIAREIQQMLVPAAPPQVPWVDLAFATRPANTVAGDYYDAFLRSTDRMPDVGPLLVVMADVAGKGVPAALLMATFQASLRALAALPEPLLDLVAGMNRYASAHSLGGLRFTTAFFAELDGQTGSLEYVNAGHNAPILWRASGSMERLDVGGLPLGIGLESRYGAGHVALERGDLLVVFTDGAVEAVNRLGVEYGEGRLLGKVQASYGASAGVVLQSLMADVNLFVGETPQHDDITYLVLRLQPGPGASERS
jgi:phosphoserine phosphatase RsbU/P